MQSLAEAILQSAEAMPAGVRTDGFTLTPSILSWSDALHVRWERDELD